MGTIKEGFYRLKAHVGKVLEGRRVRGLKLGHGMGAECLERKPRHEVGQGGALSARCTSCRKQKTTHRFNFKQGQTGLDAHRARLRNLSIKDGILIEREYTDPWVQHDEGLFWTMTGPQDWVRAKSHRRWTLEGASETNHYFIETKTQGDHTHRKGMSCLAGTVLNLHV